MIEIKDVCGSQEASAPLIIGVDTVYVHTNVRPYVDPHPEEDRPPMEGLFIYDEIQYTKDEYIKIMAEKDMQNEQEVTDLQLAMASLYETASAGGVK